MTFVDDAGLRRLVALAAEPALVADRFELGALIGEGGMGSVYEAWDREGQALVALKLLQSGGLEHNDERDAATRARFEREAQALAALSHPGIVRYVAHGSTRADERYLVMERLTGVTLAARLAEGPLGVLDALHVGHGIAAALAAAHALTLVHRDIKPSNVFLEDRDPRRSKLLDFGLARARQAPAVTRAGALVGTPGYMAPEQARGASVPDAASDLFSLGVVLFECLTGRAPFSGADTEALLVKLLVEAPPRVSDLCPTAPPRLDALIARLLAKEPGERPDAGEVARELAELLAALLAESSSETATPGAASELAGELPATPPAAIALKATSLAATPLAEAPLADAPLTEAPPAATPLAATRPGTLIAGKYRVARALGSGGMGIVMLARHETLDRNVAIKLLRARDDEHSDDRVARLVREARAVSRLESEHVARVMDVGTLDDGAPFIVMEYLSGQDLAQVLRERRRLPVREVVGYVLQACKALAEAHSLGIVHRDLKPSNLFLTPRRDGTTLLKVLDFGISKLSPPNGEAPELTPGEASITAPGAILGSPLYMSPEQLQSPKRVDARTDIWSLGVVLHELVTGRSPFDADSFMAIAARIAAVPAPDLRDHCPDAPESLARVVQRCLEKDPARRFQSIDELARALSAETQDTRASAPSPELPTPPSPRRGALLLALAMAASLTAAALFIANRTPPVTNDAPVTSPSPEQATMAEPGREPTPSSATPAPIARPASSPPSSSTMSSDASPSAPAPPSDERAPAQPARASKHRTTPTASAPVRASRPSAAKPAPPPSTSKPAPTATSKPAPVDPDDPMNPALLSR